MDRRFCLPRWPKTGKQAQRQMAGPRGPAIVVYVNGLPGRPASRRDPGQLDTAGLAIPAVAGGLRSGR